MKKLTELRRPKTVGTSVKTEFRTQRCRKWLLRTEDGQELWTENRLWEAVLPPTMLCITNEWCQPNQPATVGIQ